MEMTNLVQLVIRKASGMRIDEEMWTKLSEAERKAVENVVELIKVTKKGLIYCGICGKGSFTRRGFYLHLMRVHKEDIQLLLEKELEELAVPVGQ